MKSFIAAIAAGLCMAGVQGIAHAAEVEYQTLSKFSLSAGEPFPFERLTDAKGGAMPQKQFAGKSVLVNFYTRHCAPCIKEVPKLNEVMKRRGDIHVLAITPDAGSEAAKYVSKHGLNWPVAANAETLLFDELKVTAFPSFALLDAKGRVVATVMANQLGGEDGHATVEGIERWLDLQLASTAK